MLNWVKNLFSSGLENVVNSFDKLIDNAFTSDEERLSLKNEFRKIIQVEKLKMIDSSKEFEKEITNRWLSDNEHVITRLVRPIIVIFLYILFGAVVLSDGNIGEFKINPAYIPVLQTLLVTVTVAYFGSRGLEKVQKIKKGI